ncbi:MAG TPA: sulfotransferase [Kofleriaceae bacterium]|nr:sulfotransferase [Kofleriaceae bacterium]
MKATVLAIVRKNRDPARAAALVAARDFECVPLRDACPEQVLDNPHVSLYALDPDHRQALFVETPPDCDLRSRPFLYQAQAEHATQVIAVPYPLFFDWAERMPRANEVVVIHSSGRCGSTLLSRMLHEVDVMLALSEPDVFTQVTEWMVWGELTADEARPLLAAAARHYWKAGLKPGASWLVMKLRSQVNAIIQVLDQALPDARHLYIYRNAEDVIASYLRVAGKPETVERLRRWMSNVLAPRGSSWSVDQIYADHGHVGLQLIYWAWVAEAYLAMRDRGRDVPAIRYEALVAQPDRVMGELFRRWGLWWSESIARRVLAEDSQEGTHHARVEHGIVLTDAERAVVRRLLPVISRIASPDAILPGTI